MFSLIYAWINNREAGVLRRHGAHYDVIVMTDNLYVDTTVAWVKVHTEIQPLNPLVPLEVFADSYCRWQPRFNSHHTYKYPKIFHITILRPYIDSCINTLTAENHQLYYGANFVVIGGTGCCPYDKRRCRQWRRSRLHNGSRRPGALDIWRHNFFIYKKIIYCFNKQFFGLFK